MKKKLSCLSIVLIAAIVVTACKKELKVNEPGNLVPKTVTEDASIPAININETRLHAETFGNPADPMVVILHGGPGADYRSMLNVKALASDGYFVVFYDQRGSGLSERKDKNSYSLQLMLDDLTGVIGHYRKSKDQKIFLLGHSWGAMLATAYVNSYPATINGVILAEPGGFTWDQTSDYVSRTKDMSPFSENSNDALYPDQLFTGKENEHEILDYKMAVVAAFDTREGNPLGIAGVYPYWRFGAVIQSALFDIGRKDGFDWTTHLSQYKTKVLFCYSELNKAYGAGHAQLLSSAYPNVQLEMIKGTGHEMFYFGWENFYPVIKNYLDALR
ncbi:MAG TPA: alpha/beta hydrolase [Puia sp.]|nr:alpha/beta hydrolase [Puia sp.]